MRRNTVALLRGINVGKAKRVAMADLRGIVEGIGGANVRTVLNSGNVAFASRQAPDTLRNALETTLVDRLGVFSAVTVLKADEMDAIVEGNTLAEVADNPSRLQVAVLADAETASSLKPLLGENWSPERFALGGRAAYLWCPDGMMKSKLPGEVAAIVGESVTTRNWATVLKLHALLGEEAGGPN